MGNNFFPKKSVFYLVMSKNILEPDRLQMKIRCTCIASWVTKAINTRPGYIVLTAFFTPTVVTRTPLKVTLQCIACLVEC